jgi:hypothetical protein
MIKISTLLIGSLLAANMLLLPAAAHAAPSPLTRISLQPCDDQGNVSPEVPYFTATAHRGDTVTFHALVGNLGKTPVNAVVRPVDMRTGVFGGLSAGNVGARLRSTGAWVSLPMSRVRVSPDKGAVLTVRVRVPARATSGQYVAGLMAFVPPPRSATGRVSIQVVARIVDAILITVPGKVVKSFRARSLSFKRRPGGMYAVAQIQNTGNMLLKGWAHVWIWKIGQRKAVVDRALTLDTTAPHGTIHYPIRLPGRYAKGMYRYSLKVWWAGGRSLRRAQIKMR